MFDILNHIPGISIYPIISLSIFFLFFVGLVFWAVTTDKNYLKKMGELPLENNSPEGKYGGEENEN